MIQTTRDTTRRAVVYGGVGSDVEGSRAYFEPEWAHSQKMSDLKDNLVVVAKVQQRIRWFAEHIALLKLV